LAIANKPAQMLWPDQINHLNKTFVLICFARREGIAPTCWLTGGEKKRRSPGQFQCRRAFRSAPDLTGI